MQGKWSALAPAALAGVLALASNAVGYTPNFFQRWAYPWGPWTPDTPHIWGAVPPYDPRPIQPGVGTWRDLSHRRGIVEVHLPDERGLLYVNGNPTPLRGPVQTLHTEVLKAGQSQLFELRAAFRSGDDLLIEDRTIAAHAGERAFLVFDGVTAMRVKLPAPTDGAEQLPPPRQLPPATH